MSDREFPPPRPRTTRCADCDSCTSEDRAERRAACAKHCAGDSKQQGMRCGLSPKVGRSFCKLHGGNIPIKHGLRTVAGPPASLRERIAELENDPKLLDRRHHAAHVYALGEQLLSRIADGAMISPEDAGNLLPIYRELLRAVNDQDKQDIGNRACDIAEGKQHFMRFLHVVMPFVQEDQRPRAIAAIRELIGSGDTDSDQPGLARSDH